MSVGRRRLGNATALDRTVTVDSYAETITLIERLHRRFLEARSRQVEHLQFLDGAHPGRFIQPFANDRVFQAAHLDRGAKLPSHRSLK